MTIKSAVKVHALWVMKYLRQWWEAAPIYCARQGSLCFTPWNVSHKCNLNPDMTPRYSGFTPFFALDEDEGTSYQKKKTPGRYFHKNTRLRLLPLRLFIEWEPVSKTQQSVFLLRLSVPKDRLWKCLSSKHIIPVRSNKKADYSDGCLVQSSLPSSGSPGYRTHST